MSCGETPLAEAHTHTQEQTDEDKNEIEKKRKEKMRRGTDTTRTNRRRKNEKRKEKKRENEKEKEKKGENEEGNQLAKKTVFFVKQYLLSVKSHHHITLGNQLRRKKLAGLFDRSIAKRNTIHLSYICIIQ